MESIGFKEWSSAAVPWALGFVLDARKRDPSCEGATVRREELGEVNPNRRQPHPPNVAEPIFGRPMS